MVAEEGDDIKSKTYLPPDIEAYLKTYSNDAIASKVLLKNDNKHLDFENNVTKKSNTNADDTKPLKDNEGEIVHDKYINERIASVEQPSFKIFGFEFAPIFIPLERRLQVDNGI